MNAENRRRIGATLALALGVFLALALLPVNLTGPLGHALGPALWRALGIGAIGLPVLGVLAGLAGFGRLGGVAPRRVAILTVAGAVLIPYVIGVLGRVEQASFLPPIEDWSWTARATGWFPGFLARAALDSIGVAGGLIAGFVVLTGTTLVTLAWHPLRRLEGGADGVAGAAADATGDAAEAQAAPPRKRATRPRPEPLPPPPPLEPEAEEPPAEPPPPVSHDEVLPPLDLLAPPSRAHEEEDEAELDRLGELLLSTLRTFKVDGTLAGRTTGPSVSQFEVVPAAGVKAGRIVALADDLAITMRTPSLRVAPLPGRGAVGVEIPNPHPRMVTLREILESDAWQRSTATLPVVLGRDVEGKPVIGDLARMPHLLVAGATGSGKSVAINTIITSLVYRYPKRLLWFVMIDPKMVELSIYGSGPGEATGLPHLRKHVITDNRDAASALNWAVQEMNRRYKLLQANGARQLGDFNRKVREGKPLRHPPDTRPTLSSIAHGGDGAPAGEAAWREEYTEGELPMIVVIVDELADLMMTVQGEIEKPLAMLAQKARAIGIHLILATQRPSVNVLTGLIKANFPSRMAFRVASKVDSRTILDQNGAEALLGNGDMLWIPPGKSEPVRIQGAYIGTDETERLIEWYRGRGEAAAAEGRPDIVEEGRTSLGDGEGADGAGGDEGQRDALFRQAAELCIQHQGGSTSLLQRRLGIGYGRAARIIDQLHDAGILGPPNGSKPREVQVAMHQLDEYS